MDKFDFGLVYHKVTAEELKQDEVDSHINEQSNALRAALGHDDYLKAAEVLKQAGTCNWPKLLPRAELLVESETHAVREFKAAYVVDRGTTSVSISEMKSAGGAGLFNSEVKQYIPRLTIKDDSCSGLSQR